MERILSDQGSKFKDAEERLICAFKALLKKPEATKWPMRMLWLQWRSLKRELARRESPAY